MAEEQRCQAPPEGPRLCSNNCGFFGSPAMLDLCSKCFRDYRLKQEQEASAKMAVEKSLLVSAFPEDLTASSDSVAEQSPSAAASSLVPPAKQEPCSPPLLTEPSTPDTPIAPSAASAAPAAQPEPGRCTSCRKRVGLTGFKCRCGETFCGSHRYPEKHSCSFDFKAAGRVEIARANPVVKAEKLQKI